MHKLTLTSIFAVIGLALSSCTHAGAPTHVPAKTAKFPTMTNSIGMTLVYIPSGDFLMGDSSFPDARPVHKVELSGFWIGAYLVTNKEFEHFKKRLRPIESQGDKTPVTRITYNDAVTFCAWLSKHEHHHYRLPTEAEWEYAARGGLVQQSYPWGSDPPDGRANVFYGPTSNVDKFAPNNWGLYDMCGNVREYTSDWYSETYYAISPSKYPKGPSSPDKTDAKVVRGGFYASEMKVGERAPFPIDVIIPDATKFNDWSQSDGSGFRVVMEDPSTHRNL